MDDMELDLERGTAGNPPRLDDESRVKVLSPSMLVFKRFVRNRLAVAGIVILGAMFLFSFVGAMFMPYTQSQTFYRNDVLWKEYASLAVNNELRYTVREGGDFPLAARSAFILAKNAGKNVFEANGKSYSWEALGETGVMLYESSEVATALGLKGNYAYTVLPGKTLTDEVKAAFEAAAAADEAVFEAGGESFSIAKTGKSLGLYRSETVALASMYVADALGSADAATVTGFPFRAAAETALAEGETTFVYEGNAYTLRSDPDRVTVLDASGAEYAMLSPYIAQMISPDLKMTAAFKDAILDAVKAKQTSFTFTDAAGETDEYQVYNILNNYSVKRRTTTQVFDAYAPISRAHWLGTDANGMDEITRLMYGGRVSLMVGFVVVLIELAIGVVIGGVAGYFGGKVDLALMRFIDLFNAIPSYPIIITVGVVMDTMEVNPYHRIFILMILLGLLGWTGIARVVRGQILTLREQDFMVATEAAGIRTSARIFRHLVPNVMPLLIVQATMSLGGIIITEATLSFLGLGLKYPMASWGTIINSASDIYTMTNHWNLWIPAGVLILITVLGFNFVGDGLRDAFDPRMKR